MHHMAASFFPETRACVLYCLRVCVILHTHVCFAHPSCVLAVRFECLAFALQAVLLVSSVAHQLIRANDLGGRDWKIVVIDDPSLNAFVTPGGMVCVFTGLLSTLRTRDQLAAVISHEMGHAIARHAHESITASLVTTEIVVFLTLVLGIPFSAIRMAKLVSPDSLRFDLHHSRYRSA